MPISRKKTCVQCRKAKARCSLTLPRCARCIDKGLSCEYAAVTIPRMAPYSTIATNTANDGRSGNLHDGATDFRRVSAKHGRQQLGVHPDPESGPLSESIPLAVDAPVLAPSLDSSDTWPATMQADLGAGADMAFTIASMIEPCHNVMRFMSNIDMHVTQNPATDEADDARLRNPVNGSGTHSNVLAHDSSSCMLTSRRGLTANAILSTRTIFGQVCAYPAMMVSGHALPPFIHSRCALDDSTTYNCAKAQKHECLGKTLSICAALIGMWLERTPASSPFVWETIYKEIAKLDSEYESYDMETSVESMQAMTIYMLLQAQDTDTIVKNDVKFLLTALAHTCQKVHETLEYNTFVDTLDNPLDRKTWALYEATRRTICLIYTVEIFLEVRFRQHDFHSCQKFSNAPLPCIRDLWEVPSTYEWKKRYNAFLRARSAEKILTLGDYKLSQHLSAEEFVRNTTTGDSYGCITKDVLRWCEGLDQLGTLITLASALIKYELESSEIAVGYVKVP
ncbi:uncharacterized protein TrAFT101_010954 [Trichoderma asperellum]|nr:hypothetical protein TrAFT101_010954 [Trichoderma asperellum]